MHYQTKGAFASERVIGANRFWVPLVALVSTLILAMSMGGNAHAQQVNRDIGPLCSVSATATQTFATTSYADLAAATCTFTPKRSPTETDAGISPVAPALHVFASLDVQKATTTTGTCAIYINGAIAADSARTIDVAAKEGTMSFVYRAALTTNGSQVVKLQCKSGDTAVFTVNSGYMIVEQSF